MSPWQWIFSCAAGVLLAATMSMAAASTSFITLSYHDVRDTAVEEDPFAISTANLVAHFAWLREHDYHPVSIQQILDARNGGTPLPPRAILLTFDDGYASFHSKVLPLLRLFKYPAVLALVGSWMDATHAIDYGDRQLTRADLVSWDQVREALKTGLVEVASHSYDLHRGIPANPQGNTQPAAVTRLYDGKTGAYETDAAYRARLRGDFARNRALILRELGLAPRVMVWPYGETNMEGVAISAEAGMPITLTLDDGLGDAGRLARVPRQLIYNNPDLGTLLYQIRFARNTDPVRAAHVDLDYVFDPDPDQQEKNLGVLIERIKNLHINTVYLQAFADPDGDGVAAMLYFPNRHLPVRANLFNRAAWQLKTRAGVEVFAWMPLLAYRLPDADTRQRLAVVSTETRKIYGNAGYARLSPFDPEARRVIGEIFEDLGKSGVFKGLLIHDDAYLTDFEDAHPAAQAYYAQQWGLPATIAAIRADPQLMTTWTARKTDFLTDFSLEMAARVRFYRPDLLTARNVYARVVMEPESERWFAQSLPRLIDRYDQLAVMAMPFMEEAEQPLEWLKSLVNVVKRHPGALKKTVFELQTIDWRTSKPVPDTTLMSQIRLLREEGAVNMAYYPDDFLNDQPALKALQQGFSLETFPYRQ